MSCPKVYAQHLFLWCIGAIYMFAFSSLYFQVPGLYGKNGIMPAALKLNPIAFCEDSHEKCDHWASIGECEANPNYMLKNCQKSCAVCKKGQSLSMYEKLESKLTLLWFSPYLGLDTESGMELICIIGTLLSFSVLMFQRFRNKFVFATLWLLYFSVYMVGQTFLWFQWDILLLEAGFLTIFVAPFFVSVPFTASPDSNLMFWLVRWLLFRLMFASGVVKLTSMCPTWWGLEALNWHYESQCIPSPLAWYAHQLPEWFQRLSVVATYVIEIAIPFLFFSPVRTLKLFAFYTQVLLQMLIIFTGNYNFFNLLTTTLCVSLLDDQHIMKIVPSFISKIFSLETNVKEKEKSKWKRVMSFSIHWIVLIGIVAATVNKFNLRWSKGALLSKIAFSKEYFLEGLHKMTQISIAIGTALFCLQILLAFYNTLMASCGKFSKALQMVKTFFFTGVAVWLFSISLVPFTDIDSKTQQNLWPVIHRWFHHSDKYQIANAYGLFRSMTGVGGRPELIIEGSYHLDGEWKEYNFLYKPGNVSQKLPFVAPHQPRLDWQMWFAALGNYQHNPWFIHLIYKLLHGQEEVLNLLGENPFSKKPPNFIRSRLYTYHYTRLPKQTTGIVDGWLHSRKIKNWWRREFSHEYTNPLDKDNPSLERYIQDMGWDTDDIAEVEITPSGHLHNVLCKLRKHAISLNPTLFMLQLFIIPFLTSILRKLFTFNTDDGDKSRELWIFILH